MRILKLMTLSLFIATSVSASTYSGGGEIYLDLFMEVTKKKKDAAYYCELIEKTDAGYLFKAFFMSGELKMEGTFADENMQVASGDFTYYYQSGEIESTGEYKENMKVGLWKRYTQGGAEKPVKVYESLETLKAIEAVKEEERKARFR